MTSVLVVRYLDTPPPVVGRIVVPIDGSDLGMSAVEPARDLALRTGAQVTVLTTRTSDGQDVIGTIDRASATLAPIAHEEEVRAEADPVDAITAVIDECDESVWVVMSSHGRGRVLSSVLGSVAERIVAEVDVPVMIIGPAYDRDLHFQDGPVIVAHDAEHAPDLDVTTALCRAAESRAVVMEVRVPEGDEPSPAVVAWADELAERGVETSTELLPGPSMPRSVADAATEIGASAILVTSRAMTGLKRFVLGSHTAATVRHSAVPVIVCRAE